MNASAPANSSPSCFDPVDFIHDGRSQPLLDPDVYPFLYNDRGLGRQTAVVEGRLIELQPLDPTLQAGTRYTNIRHNEKTVESDSGQTYTITLFDFGVDEVRYESLPATPFHAQAFGMTLLQGGECIRFPYRELVMADYSYGKWAAYESPYLGKGRGRELLTYNPTDLEYHDFAHVFFSRDTLPLVISVARWRPYAGEICLADLWLQPGDALVLPPKLMPPPPHGGQSPRDLVLDLHGNRNSALACRFVDGRPILNTTTILGNSKAMSDPHTKPHYHEEKTPTLHAGLRAQAIV